MEIDIQHLGPNALARLIRAAEQRKHLLDNRRPAAVVRRQLIRFASQAGYTIAELVQAPTSAHTPAMTRKKTKKTRRKAGSSKVAAKYRDPDNKHNTWTGRGRPPRWLAEKTKHGRSATDFLIPGLARPTPRKNRPVGQRSVFKVRA